MRKLIPLLFWLLASPALAGNPGLIVSGNTTAGNFPSFVNNWTVQDSGASFASPGTIGGTTPGAGTFTTLTATTSTTTPLVIGGTGAASTLTLESTSGTGTSDSILFKTGSQTTDLTIANNGGLVVGNATGGSQGAGTINVSSNFYVNGVVVGGGGGSGTVSSGTVGGYAVYTGTTTVGSSSTLTTATVPYLFAIATQSSMQMFGGL